jgi:hypothetical protein
MRTTSRRVRLVWIAVLAPIVAAILAPASIYVSTGRPLSPAIAGTIIGILMGGWLAGLGSAFALGASSHSRLFAALSPTGSARGEGRDVAISGVITAGPAGALRAPLSGAECVWWSTHVRLMGPDGKLSGSVDRQQVTPFVLDGDTSGPVVIDAPAEAFDATVAFQSASTGDPDRAEDVQRAVRDLEVTLEPGAEARVMELTLDVGRRVVAVGVLEKGEAYRGSGAGGLRDVAIVTSEAAPELLARLERQVRGTRRVVGLGLALLVVAAACAVVEVARPDW